MITSKVFSSAFCVDKGLTSIQNGLNLWVQIMYTISFSRGTFLSNIKITALSIDDV